MVQEHGLGARPYDCSKCTLKFFFTTELDHHILTFHRTEESKIASAETNARETEEREPEKRDCDGSVTVKEEVMQIAEEEEEEVEINVDDHVGQEKREVETQREEQKPKMEVDGETILEKAEA